jgi:hypothetical protein
LVRRVNGHKILPLIPIVADLLANRDAISDFLQNRDSIYKNIKPFSVPQAEACSNRLETSVIAALETVWDLLAGNQVCRLLSRFASIQLTWLIDIYTAVAATDRTQGKAAGTVAIGMSKWP